MKNILYLLTLLSTQLLLSQSNEIKARIEFEDAEKYFSDANYNEALTHLNNAQKLIGSWNHKISYMKIMCYDAIVNYNDWDQSLKILDEEVLVYMTYADKNSNNVNTDKFRKIYEIDKKIEVTKKINQWSEMLTFKEANQALENKNYTIVLKLYRKAADNGNGLAMDKIG